MFPGRRRDTLREVPKPASDYDPIEVDAPRPGDTNITVNAHTGTVTTENPDGSLEVGLPPKAQRERRRGDFDANLAEDLEDLDLSALASTLLEGIEADIASRQEWEETLSKGAEYLGVRIETASTDVSVEGSISKVRHTLLLEAVMRSWANTRAELLPSGGPVKVRDDNVPTDTPKAGVAGGISSFLSGPNPASLAQPANQNGGEAKPSRSELADALELDMNHYLTVVDREYYPDTSRMLFSRALFGPQFKKVYRCPIRRRPVSVWVKGVDLIVSNDTSHLSGAGRITERIPMRQSMVRRLQKSGHWRDIGLVTPSPMPSDLERTIASVEGIRAVPQLPADYRHTIYECYCELDTGSLAEDENGKDVGFPLPYRVTIDKDSRAILEIRRHWKEGDEDYKARGRYVKFGFVPGLGFYDLGYIHILGNPQRAMTALLRESIDAEMLAIFPGGVMAKGPGTRQTSTVVRPALGEYVVMETGGQPLSDVFSPLPYKGMSPNTLALMGAIDAAAHKLSGSLEIPVGEGRVGDVPVQTMMAYVDAIAKVPSAVHKDDHMAQQEEFELLKDLFAEEPDALWKYAKSPARKWEIAEEISDQELVPAADPNTPSSVHRLMRLTALVELASLPQFQGIPNFREIWAQGLQLLHFGDNPELTMPPQPPQQAPPDPKAMVALGQLQAKQQANQISAQKVALQGEEQQREAAAAVQESSDRAADRQAELAATAMKETTARLKAGVDIQHKAADSALDHAQQIADRAQADRHHQDDLATRLQPPMGEPQ